MKNNLVGYARGALYGLYFYALQQGIYLVRFKELNTQVNMLDLYLVVVGILSVWLFMFFRSKMHSKKARIALFVAFILAVPIASVGALLGGLLGPIGILAYGLIPFAVLMTIVFILFGKSRDITPAM